MPAAGLPWLSRTDLLTADEVGEVVRQLSALGLRRVRLTGGEPTLRPDLERIVGLVRADGAIEDLSLSTNGVRLLQDPSLASRLRRAGLDRINLSADSLRPERVQAIARRNLGFDAVRAATAAQAAGLSPVKLNMVVVRGTNDDEIGDFALLTLQHPWHVRFIELMPVGELAEVDSATARDPRDRSVPSDELLERAAEALAPWGGLRADAGPDRGNGPARYYRAPGAPGTLGVITPLSHTYCAACNRVRLTADGRLRTCLFGEHAVDLRGPLRRGEQLAPYVRQALDEKPRE